MSELILRRGRSGLALVCLLIGLLCVGCGSATQVSGARSHAALAPGLTPYTVKGADGRTRSYILYAPPGATPKPLVLVYHGALGTAEGAAQEAGYLQAAEAGGFVVAFLQGYEDTWNEGAGGTPARLAHVNDVEFTSLAISQIEQRYSIDPNRIAAAGFSNGALLADLLGCRLANRLALIVPVEGPLPVSVSASCRPARPISVLEIHGTADHSIPYKGGHFVGVGGGTTVLSAPGGAARWAALDGCRHHLTAAAAGPIVLSTYSQCHAGVVVQLRSIIGGSHNWPAGIGGLVSEFLNDHPRNR